MSETEISSEFEYSASFLRILIPGIIATTLASFLVALNYFRYIFFFKESISESVWALVPLGGMFVIVSMLIGLMMNVLIIPLTMILEGYILEKHPRKYVLSVIRDILKEKQWKEFTEYQKVYSKSEKDSVEIGAAYTSIYNYFSHCLYKLSKNPTIKVNELKNSIMPTRLGNVFKSMEVYPKWKYGMNSVFFWTRIQLSMKEENKTSLDKSRAFVDMFVELTWIFLFAAIIYSVNLAYNGNYLFSAVSLLIFLLLSLFSYDMAVQSALNFGHYVRSMFDLYRDELWDEMKNGLFSKLDSLPEKERWENVFKYLWFYNVVQCQNCGRFYESTVEHKCEQDSGFLASSPVEY